VKVWFKKFFFSNFRRRKHAITARDRHSCANVSQPAARAAVAGVIFILFQNRHRARNGDVDQHILAFFSHFLCVNSQEKKMFFIFVFVF
jgi:hypothetical protein